MDQVEHPRKQHGLRLEAGLVVCVGKNEEDILQDRNKELLEEGIRCCGIGLRNVSNQLQAHVETSVFDLAIVVLACPHARVDDEFELSIVELKKSRKAVKINGAEECEEFDSVLRELREVLVDHLQCALKYILHDGGYLIFHKRLQTN